MFEISDLSVDYHSLTKDENCIFVTDSWRPIISYQVISDRRDTSLRSACIKMNQWEKILMSNGRLSMKESRCIRFRTMRLRLPRRMMKGILREDGLLSNSQAGKQMGFKEFQVKPMVGGNLSYAKCIHESPCGQIEVAWERDAVEEKLYHLQVTVPVGAHCDVICNQLQERIGSGTYEFE